MPGIDKYDDSGTILDDVQDLIVLHTTFPPG